MLIKLSSFVFFILIVNAHKKGRLKGLQLLSGRAVGVINLHGYRIIPAVGIFPYGKAVPQLYGLIHSNLFKHPIIIDIIDLKRKLVRIRVCYDGCLYIVYGSRAVVPQINGKIHYMGIGSVRCALFFSQNKVIGLFFVIIVAVRTGGFGDPYTKIGPSHLISVLLHDYHRHPVIPFRQIPPDPACKRSRLLIPAHLADGFRIFGCGQGFGHFKGKCISVLTVLLILIPDLTAADIKARVQFLGVGSGITLKLKGNGQVSACPSMGNLLCIHIQLCRQSRKLSWKWDGRLYQHCCQNHQQQPPEGM